MEDIKHMSEAQKMEAIYLYAYSTKLNSDERISRLEEIAEKFPELDEKLFDYSIERDAGRIKPPKMTEREGNTMEMTQEVKKISSYADYKKAVLGKIKNPYISLKKFKEDYPGLYETYKEKLAAESEKKNSVMW